MMANFRFLESPNFVCKSQTIFFPSIRFLDWFPFAFFCLSILFLTNENWIRSPLCTIPDDFFCRLMEGPASSSDTDERESSSLMLMICGAQLLQLLSVTSKPAFVASSVSSVDHITHKITSIRKHQHCRSNTTFNGSMTQWFIILVERSFRIYLTQSIEFILFIAIGNKTKI